MPPRYRDDELPIPDQLAQGEHVPGEVVFRPPPLETHPFRFITDYDAELQRQRSLAFNHAYTQRPARTGSFTTRSLRRIFT